MPSLFNHFDPLTSQFKGAWKDPDSIVALLPPSPIQNELVAQLSYLKALRAEKADVISTTEAPSRDGDLFKYYSIINSQSNIIDNDSNQSDLFIEKRYLQLTHDKFQEWFQQFIELQTVGYMTELNIKYAENSNIFIAEENAKRNIITYQTNAIQTLKEWLLYIDKQIDEQTTIQKNLETIIATQQRKGIFTLSDISYLEKWRYGMDVVFWFLVILFIVIIICNYSQELFNMYSNFQKIANNQINKIKKLNDTNE